MPEPDPFQAEVARLSLEASRALGFALAGGHALIAHGVIARPTEDVDLFTDHDRVVHAAAEAVAAALTQAGLTVEVIRGASDLGDVFDGLDEDLVELEVHRGENTVRLQLVRFDRHHPPVTMAVGPVLHLDDVIGTKVAAMVTRAQPRDFIDVGALLPSHQPGQLVDLGRQADPALTDEEFADAMRRLDRLDDSVFEQLYGLTPDQIAELRSRFTAWPRA